MRAYESPQITLKTITNNFFIMRRSPWQFYKIATILLVAIIFFFFFFLRFETPQNAKKKGAPQNNLFLVVLLELVTHNHIIHICDRG